MELKYKQVFKTNKHVVLLKITRIRINLQ